MFDQQKRTRFWENYQKRPDVSSYQITEVKLVDVYSKKTNYTKHWNIFVREAAIHCQATLLRSYLAPLFCVLVKKTITNIVCSSFSMYRCVLALGMPTKNMQTFQKIKHSANFAICMNKLITNQYLPLTSLKYVVLLKASEKTIRSIQFDNQSKSSEGLLQIIFLLEDAYTLVFETGFDSLVGAVSNNR